jgi:hypothetical protein
MNQLAAFLVAAAGDRAQTRFWEFFAANIRNPHTCKRARSSTYHHRGIGARKTSSSARDHLHASGRLYMTGSARLARNASEAA